MCKSYVWPFNPFMFDENHHFLNNNDFDPDNNYYNQSQLPNSDYLLASEICMLFDQDISKANFSVMYVNCRDINRSFVDTSNTIAQLDFKLTVIAVNETWTTRGTENLYNTDGYS